MLLAAEEAALVVRSMLLCDFGAALLLRDGGLGRGSSACGTGGASSTDVSGVDILEQSGSGVGYLGDDDTDDFRQGRDKDTFFVSSRDYTISIVGVSKSHTQQAGCSDNPTKNDLLLASLVFSPSRWSLCGIVAFVPTNGCHFRESYYPNERELEFRKLQEVSNNDVRKVEILSGNSRVHSRE